jgi:RNA polymerase sigma-70 factor (ECF subfamily)
MAPRIQRGRLRLVESPVRPSSEGDAAVPATASSLERVEPPASLRIPKGTRGAFNELPDAQLVVLSAEGNMQAFEVLYRRHASFAIHLATRIEGSPRDVEDIVHDAFLRAYERLRDLSDKSAFRGWLGSIVVHAVRSRMRRARLMNLLGLGRTSEPVDLDAIASSDASPHVRAQLAQIYALLRTLSADDRIAWTLRNIEGHELEAVANLTRCSLATVKRRISRAQQFLDEHFVDPTTKEATVKNEVST